MYLSQVFVSVYDVTCSCHLQCFTSEVVFAVSSSACSFCAKLGVERFRENAVVTFWELLQNDEFARSSSEFSARLMAQTDCCPWTPAPSCMFPHSVDRRLQVVTLSPALLIGGSECTAGVDGDCRLCSWLQVVSLLYRLVCCT